MTRRRLSVVAIAATLAATLAVLAATPAGAATAPLQVVGRRVVTYSFAGGATVVTASAQGQILDTNGNGLYDSLQARGALLEVRGVRRLVIYSVLLQVFRDGAWRNAVVNPLDVIDDNYVRSTTAPVRLCPYAQPDRTYRAVQNGAVRRDDGILSARTTVSNNFTWRILQNDPACVAPPPPPPPPPPAAEADVAIAKTASAASVPGTADTAFTYTLTVRNLDTTDPASSVVVTDTLPGELNLAALPAGCTDTNPDPDVVALRCALGTLDPGETNTITVQVVADASDFTDASIVNSAAVSSTTADPNAANNSAAATVTVRPLADVVMDKTADQATVTVPGDTFRYVLRVTNTGPSPAEGVTVYDNLPAGVDLAGPLPTGCAPDAATPSTDDFVCSFGTLAPGATASVSIDVVSSGERADDTLPITNVATARTTTYEQDLTDNSDSATVTVVASAA